MPLVEVVREATGSNPCKCYQCIKCTSGCPLADQFDLTPNQVMRSVQLNDTAVLESKSIWLCASCHTCTTRCPQQIDVAGVMDTLCIESRKRGIKPAVPEIARFNDLFLRGIKIFGRTYELGLGAAFNMALGRPLRDFDLGKRLFARGKMKILPHFAKGTTQAEKIAANPKAVGYYPGCSLSSTSIEYGKSVRNIASAMDIELVEPKDWVCCGSSPAHSTDAGLANLLPMKTVTTVEQMGLDTVTSPCSACFSRLKHAEHAVRNKQAVRNNVSEALGYDYKGSVKVRHMIDVIVDHAGLDEVARRVVKPLKGLKAACYYGCLITRPSGITGAKNPEYPVKMDRLLKTLGAETIDWSRKTECCGGSLAINKTEVAIGMMKRTMDDARACGAETIVTMCPICHLNLDSRQSEMGYDNEIPIFQATQLMALAFGQGEDKAALGHNLTDPKPYLREKGMLSYEAKDRLARC
ncbi:MAG: 8-methylmenaquinol:fumarate reductase membrane anchor subunit [Gammaproteobacteria bacterium]|nr:8-methylmenaquinol:fumarate reductase membrane anchor subunit [Gammaproteobacteria bacterium]